MKLKKELKDMNLMDRFLFAETMENPHLMELLLEIILGKDVLLEHKPQSEKEIRKHPFTKFVRLDVLAVDEDGTVYNAEAQQTDTKMLPKRSRHYQAMVDSKLLPAGEVDYNKLNDLYIIMIGSFDLFGQGLYKYDFTYMCRNVPGLELSDGASRIFLNTKGSVQTDDVNQELIDLLRYMEESTDEVAENACSDRIRQIHEGITTIKEDAEVGVKLMNRWEERMQDREEGRQEGIQIMKTAMKMQASGKSYDEIADELKITVEKVIEILE